MERRAVNILQTSWGRIWVPKAIKPGLLGLNPSLRDHYWLKVLKCLVRKTLDDINLTTFISAALLGCLNFILSKVRRNLWAWRGCKMKVHEQYSLITCQDNLARKLLKTVWNLFQFLKLISRNAYREPQKTILVSNCNTKNVIFLVIWVLF